MKGLIGAAAVSLLTACATTGNPREGGLFGWSESMARDRQAQRQSRVETAESELSREMARGDALQSRHQTAQGNLQSAAARQADTKAKLHAQQSRLLAKVDQLEASSPTAATSSRARSYRLKVNTIAAQIALPPRQRAERLHVVEAEIDTALARLVR